MVDFTIDDLKKHLGPGLGLRKNKYLLEIPIPGVEGAKINVLARSAGLPERNITTTTVFHKGRKYNVRGETDYIGTYDVSIVDDSAQVIRRKFDEWLKYIDDSKPFNAGLFSGASYESGVGAALDAIRSGVSVANAAQRAINDPREEIGGFVLGAIDPGQTDAVADYQTDINIWQLSATGDKIYGYKLQNAFPQQVGIVLLDDGDANTLSEFSVTFAFSEFLPLEGVEFSEELLTTALGGDAEDVIRGIEAFVR
jgi:hypothetical protein